MSGSLAAGAPDRAPISLVIASHRRGARIGPTIASVFAQTTAPEEVIVFNDGGSTETSAFLAAHYAQVRVVEGTGGSPAASRNLGAAAATCRYVMFLDDDDVLHERAVETLWRTLQAFPRARAAFADHTFTDAAQGIRLDNHHRTLPTFRKLDEGRPMERTAAGRLFGRDLYYPMLHAGLLQQPWLVERDLFMELGGFDETFKSNEDWELYLRLVSAAPIALTDDVISDHLVEAGRPHVSRSESLDATGKAILQKHLKLATQKRDMRAILILRRRLGRMYKTDGDRVADADLREAWSRYVTAFQTWPFDYVVALRVMGWPFKMLFRG